MGFLIIDLNDLCAEPITISQPRGQLSSGKRAYCSVNISFLGQSHQEPFRGEAAIVYHKAALYILCAATFPSVTSVTSATLDTPCRRLIG
ncbi:MAG: hypothetical protein ACFWUL_06085 [Dialister sp.]|jgi:hypothetical protein